MTTPVYYIERPQPQNDDAWLSALQGSISEGITQLFQIPDKKVWLNFTVGGFVGAGVTFASDRVALELEITDDSQIRIGDQLYALDVAIESAVTTAATLHITALAAAAVGATGAGLVVASIGIVTAFGVGWAYSKFIDPVSESFLDYLSGTLDVDVRLFDTLLEEGDTHLGGALYRDGLGSVSELDAVKDLVLRATEGDMGELHEGMIARVFTKSVFGPSEPSDKIFRIYDDFYDEVSELFGINSNTLERVSWTDPPILGELRRNDDYQVSGNGQEWVVAADDDELRFTLNEDGSWNSNSSQEVFLFKDIHIRADFTRNTENQLNPTAASDLIIDIGSGGSSLFGASGDDYIFGGAGNDTVRGNDGNDYLYGDGGANSDSGSGDDTLYGGTGTDRLYGGRGFDTYMIEGGGLDIINDEDKSGKVEVIGLGVLTGGELEEDSTNRYTGQYGETYIEWNGTLLIQTPDLVRIDIEDFSNGDLGIHLDEEPDDDDAENYRSPLVLDLDGDGLEITALGTTPSYFDHDKDGFAERTAWVNADDGLLVVDVNQNGTIDNPDELFGYSGAARPESIPDGAELSGFAKLAQYDTNGDGIVSTLDAGFGDLRIWRDITGDGYSQDYELFTLEALNIASISTSSTSSNQEIAGNPVTDIGSFAFGDGSVGTVGDVWFRFDPHLTKYRGDVEASSDVADLPDLKGYGEVKDLHVAMTEDPALGQIVEAFSAVGTGDLAGLSGAVDAILMRWLGVEDVAADSRGYFVDGRQLAGLEAIDGDAFRQQLQRADPLPQAGAVLTTTWRDFHSNTMARLIAQTELGRDFIPELTYTSNAFLKLTPGTSLSDVLARFAPSSPADPLQKLLYWRAVSTIVEPVRTQFVEQGAAFDAAFDAALSADGVLIDYASVVTVLAGSNGDDVLWGRSSGDPRPSYNTGAGDVLIGGTGDDLLIGGLGSNTYYCGLGQGNDTIGQPAYRGFGADTVRLVGLNRDDVTFSRSLDPFGHDLIITFTPSGERLTLEQIFSGDDPHQFDIVFDDGMTVRANDVALEATPGTAGDDILVSGGSANSALDGAGGNDLLIGGIEDNTYHFGLGYGSDRINERGISNGDRVVFGAGISPNDVTFERGSASDGDLVIRLYGATDTLTITQQFASASPLIDVFEFGDGTLLSAAEILDSFSRETGGNDTITGSVGADVFGPSSGDDLFIGLSGGDTYRIGDYDSNDTVRDGGLDVPGVVDRVEFAFDQSYALFNNPDPGTLIVTHTLSGYTTTIEFGDGYGAIEEFVFRDVVLTFDQVMAPFQGNEPDGGYTEISGTSGDDTLNGTALDEHIFGQEGADTLLGGAGNDILEAAQSYEEDADILEGGAGDDLLLGGLGQDTYRFGYGDGVDTLKDGADGLRDTAGILEFGTGISLADVTLAARFGTLSDFGETPYLEIAIAGTGDAVRVVDPFNAYSGIGEFRFDGATLSPATIASLINSPTAGDNVLLGTSEQDDLDGGAGSDVLVGADGDDTYRFGVGDGVDTIVEAGVGTRADPYGYGGPQVETDTVVFKPGITQSDLTVTAVGEDLKDMAIRINGTDDQLIIKGQLDPKPGYGNLTPQEIKEIGDFGFPTPSHTGIERFEFSGGTYLSREEMAALISIIESSGDNTVTTGDQGGTLDGGGGNDTLQGGIGNDEYIFGRNYAEDTIADSGGDADTILFNADVAPEFVQFSRIGDNGDDLLVEVGGQERLTLTVKGQFAGPDTRIETLRFADGSSLDWTAIQADLLQQASTESDDIISGFASADNINGGDGFDVLKGLGGDDILDGGAGWDVAEFSGRQSDYSIVINGETVLVTDLAPDTNGDDGSDVLFGIEQIRFLGDGSSINLVVPNQAPTALGDAFSTAEDTELVMAPAQLLFNDTDPDNGTLSIIDVGNAVGGTVFVNLAGDVVFRPTAHFNGTASFDYTVDDGNRGMATATVTIAVASVNDGPVVADDWLSTDEDVALTIAAADLLANDIDVDGPALAIASVGNAINGTVALAGTDVIFTPDAEFSGDASFTYTVDDGDGGTATATVTVSVAPVNDAPDAQPDQFQTNRATPVTIAIADLLSNDTDAEGQTVSFAWLGSGPVGGHAFVDDQNNVVFTPDVDFVGDASFDYVVTDGDGGISTGTVGITVLTANTAPVAVADTMTTAEDTAVTIFPADLTVNDQDAEGDSLTLTSIGNAINGTVALDAEGLVVFTPDADFVGEGTFDYTVDDGWGGTSTATVTVTVTPANDPPVAVADIAGTDEDTAVTILAADLLSNDSDPDNDTLTIVSVANAINGSAVLDVDGNVIFTPDADFAGSASFDYTAGDGNGGTATATVTVTVAPVNDAPVAVGSLGDLTVTEGQAVSIDLAGLFTDVDGPAMTYQVTGPDWLTVTGETLSGTPADGNDGVFTVDVRASDGTATSASAISFTLTVQDAAPTGPTPVWEDLPAPQAFTGQSADTIVHADRAEFDQATGTIDFWFKPASVSGTYGLLSRDATMQALPGHLTLRQTDDGLSLRLQTDTDERVISTSSGVTAGQWHHVALSFGTATGLALYLNGNLVGSDAGFTSGIAGNDNPLVIGANQWASAEGSADLLQDFFEGHITGVSIYDQQLNATQVGDLVAAGPDGGPNTAPVANDDHIATMEGWEIGIPVSDLLLNDSDGESDTLSFTSVSNAVNGSVEMLGDTVLFTPDAGFNGDATFNYAISDGNGGSATGTVTVTVFAGSGIRGQVVSGTSGDDTLVGTSADDVLDGGDGQDTLTGMGGNDVLVGGAGWDTLDGGEGSDVYFADHDDADTYADSGTSGIDTIWFFTGVTAGELPANFDASTSGIEVINGTSSPGMILRAPTSSTAVTWDFTGITLTGIEEIQGRNGADVITGSAGDDWIDGNENSDTLTGGAGNDLLEGDAGDDLLTGGEGNDTIWGGSGHDKVFFQGKQADYGITFSGSNAIVVDLAPGIDGDDGTDTVSSSVEEFIFLGDAANPGGYFEGTSGNDTVTGAAGNDWLEGFGGADTLFGLDGDDVLIGGSGNDTLTGGLGADTFRFRDSDGRDTITDFEDGADLIDLREMAGMSAYGDLDLVEVGSDLEVRAGGTTVVVQGFGLSAFSEDDFLI